MITCPSCGATCPETSKERKRFERRHPAKCTRHERFNRELAQGTRSVDADLGQDPDAELLRELDPRKRR